MASRKNTETARLFVEDIEGFLCAAMPAPMRASAFEALADVAKAARWAAQSDDRAAQYVAALAMVTEILSPEDVDEIEAMNLDTLCKVAYLFASLAADWAGVGRGDDLARMFDKGSQKLADTALWTILARDAG